MSDFNPAVFPLHLIVQTSEGPRCGCGWPSCTRIGKHPDGSWGELLPGEKRRSPHHPHAGYGIATGVRSGIFVVDLDGEDASRKFDELGGSDDTYTVETGRDGGGWQLYFQYPGFPVRNTIKELWDNGKKGAEAQGIDTRGEGGYVVMAGSPHKSGKTYTVSLDAPIAAAPAWLLTWLRQRPTQTDVQTYAGDAEGKELAHRRTLYKEYLSKAMPCVAGAGGDAQLFRVVQHGAYDLALPTYDVLELVKDVYDPRCDPPWGAELEERVTHKARSAKLSSTRQRHEPMPPDLIAEINQKNSRNAEPLGKGSDDFVFVTATDLAKPLPPVRYVVKHFGIAPGRPSLLAGYGGLGKTVLAQLLALHMAGGVENCWGLPIATGRVCHFDYEMTQDPLQRRYQRLALGHGIALPSCDLLLASMPNIYLSDEKAEEAYCRATEGAMFAIVDNLAAATASSLTKENESGIRKYLDRLTRVTQKTGCAFWVLAHERKASKEEGGSGLQRVRGSSAITDACGSVISISVSATGIMSLSHNKSSRKKGDDLHLKIVDCCFEQASGSPGEEDSPGLRVERVDTSSRDAEAEKKARIVLEATLSRISDAMLAELRKESNYNGMQKTTLMDGVTGANDAKRIVFAKLTANDGPATAYKVSQVNMVMLKRGM